MDPSEPRRSSMQGMGDYRGSGWHKMQTKFHPDTRTAWMEELFDHAHQMYVTIKENPNDGKLQDTVVTPEARSRAS